MHDKILIVDFGSQVTQLIARRIRELHVYCEIHPFDDCVGTLDAWLSEGSLRGVILSGGPDSVTAEQTPRIAPPILESGVPLLGICYGMQAMAGQMGGTGAAGGVR